MNKWKDDVHRDRMHRRGIWRRLMASVRVLLAVAGWVTLALALFLGGMSLLQQFAARERMLNLAGVYAGVGVALVALHALIFLLPAALERRRSVALKRRHSEAGRRIRPRPPEPAASREGMALVLVLVALALITTLLVQTQITARALARHTETKLSRAQLLNAATDTARAALQRLAEDPDLLVDTTNDNWAVTEEVTRPDGVSTRARVSDENRRFDLNNLAAADGAPAGRTPADVLFDLFSLCDDFQTSGHLSALTDWMDADDEGFSEALAYQKRDPPFAPPNRFLFDWEESLHADGGDRARYQRPAQRTTLNDFGVRPLDCITLLPVARVRPLPININTASAAVLQGVLGLGQDTLVRSILTLRAMKPIRSFGVLAALAEPGVLENLLPYLDAKSHFFRVEVRASASDRMILLRALARRDEAGRVNVVQWVF